MNIQVPTLLEQNFPVAQFQLGSERNFVYAIVDWSTRQAAVIDPHKEIDFLLAEFVRARVELTSVLLTHSHSDHTGGLPALLERFPGLPIFAHSAEWKRLKKLQALPEQIHTIEDGSKIPLGRLQIEVIHTPGHTAGGCCYLLRGETHYLFTGDTVFIRDCGRTDLDTGSNEQMFASFQKLRALAKDLGDAVILPGHHYAPPRTSSLQDEIQYSPPFQCQSSQELAGL